MRLCPTPALLLALVAPLAPAPSAAFRAPGPLRPSPPPPPTSEAPSSSPPLSRAALLRRATVLAAPVLLLLPTTPRPAAAVPPFAVMQEELGYFPVIDESTGETAMVPARSKRKSTEQAVALAKHLKATGATMYGAYWCPHCSRQRDLFGAEAWRFVNYVECAPKGYRTRFATCAERGVDGYPSWTFGNGAKRGGEMELTEIARASGFGGTFDPSRETGVPPLGGASCR